MGTIIPFPTRPMAPAILLADQLALSSAELPQLMSAVGSMGRSAGVMCAAVQNGLTAMHTAFSNALTLNLAHQRLQSAVQEAIDLAETNPDAAAGRLAELRADYARLCDATPSMRTNGA